MAETIHFASRQESIGIQAADLLVREAMKYCDNFFMSSGKRRVRKSMQLLSNTHKYQFEFYSREYFESWKSQFEELEKKAGITIEDYKQWLLQNKLNDNVFNRNKFLLYVASIKPTKQNVITFSFDLP